MFSKKYFGKINNRDRKCLMSLCYDSDARIEILASYFNYGRDGHTAREIRNNPYNAQLLEIMRKAGLLREL